MIHPVNLPVYMASRPSVYRTSSGERSSPTSPVTPTLRNPPPWLQGASYTADGRRMESGTVLNPHQPEDLWKNLFRRNFITRMNGEHDDLLLDETEKLADLNVSDPNESEDITDEAGPPSFSYRQQYLYYRAESRKPNSATNNLLGEKHEPLELKWISLNVNENTVAHHTDEFEITQKHRNPHLVVRRGQEFHISLSFYRDYQPDTDRLRLIFELGNLPLESKRTKVSLDLDSKTYNLGGWAAWIVEISDSRIDLSVVPSPTTPIGSWNLKIVWSSRDRDSVWPVYGIYILFNPWCKEDSTFIDNEDEREEYVLNDTGKIWRGTYKSIEPCPWLYGQFEDGILDACMMVLDQSKLPLSLRDSPVEVSRAISQIVNDKDDRGVLVGNWDRMIVGGTQPTAWTGSVPILREYATYGRPVKFGQCWVFAGVVTTVLRCLGIPCRPVTNYSSAHDTDTTCTVDLHFSETTGKLLKEYNVDSIWTFHVWNDCWMSRPDLPPGYSGWQAIDATPQEKSDGLYRAGPASVRAIKEGEVSFQHDSSFIFAEVNADKCFWTVDRHRNARLNSIRENEIGRMILTKKPGKHLGSGNEDMMDVTGDYKHFEMTRSERKAVMNALVNGHSVRLYDYQKMQQSSRNDVSFSLDLREQVMTGQDFHISVWMSNQSQDVRTVKLSLRLSAIMYTGTPGRTVKAESKEIRLAPLESTHTTVTVTVQDYLQKLLDQSAFLASMMALVEETGQIHTEADDCRLLKPEITIDVTTDPVVNQPFQIQLKAINPLPTFLTNCKFLLEGPGLVLPKEIPCRSVPPRGLAKVSVTLRPWKRGERAIIAHFQAEELNDVKDRPTWAACVLFCVPKHWWNSLYFVPVKCDELGYGRNSHPLRSVSTDKILAELKQEEMALSSILAKLYECRRQLKVEELTIRSLEVEQQQGANISV